MRTWWGNHRDLSREMGGGLVSSPPDLPLPVPCPGRGTLSVLGIHLPTDGALGLSSTSTCPGNSLHLWPQQASGEGWAAQRLGCPPSLPEPTVLSQAATEKPPLERGKQDGARTAAQREGHVGP